MIATRRWSLSELTPRYRRSKAENIPMAGSVLSIPPNLIMEYFGFLTVRLHIKRRTGARVKCCAQRKMGMRNDRNRTMGNSKCIRICPHTDGSRHCLHVGERFISTGLCRVFVRAGRVVASFNVWNMSNNAYIRLDGGGIGWAQALQAWACGLAQRVDMKPLLLKLTTEQPSQFMVRGRVAGIASARYTEHDYLCAQVREFSAVESAV